MLVSIGYAIHYSPSLFTTIASTVFAPCMQVLEQLVCKLLAQMPLLLRMLDHIALLDMLLAFFQAVTGMAGEGGGGAGGKRLFVWY